MEELVRAEEIHRDEDTHGGGGGGGAAPHGAPQLPPLTGPPPPPAPGRAGGRARCHTATGWALPPPNLFMH